MLRTDIVLDGSTNGLVQERLKLVLQAYRGGGFKFGRAEVFAALAEAAFQEIPAPSINNSCHYPSIIGVLISEGKGHTFESCRVRHKINYLAECPWVGEKKNSPQTHQKQSSLGAESAESRPALHIYAT